MHTDTFSSKKGGLVLSAWQTISDEIITLHHLREELRNLGRLVAKEMIANGVSHDDALRDLRQDGMQPIPTILREVEFGFHEAWGSRP